MKKNNNKKGFTLVELVIVVAVMAVLVAVAIPTVSSITGTAKDAVNDSNARTIESTIKLAEAEAASKDSDGTATLAPDDVDTALTNAKLGIEKGVFTYNYQTGAVTYVSDGTTAATSPTAGTYSIAFNGAGAVNTSSAATDDTVTVTGTAPTT